MLHNFSQINHFTNNQNGATQRQQSFGPTSIYNSAQIRTSLNCQTLTDSQILSMTRDALLHGSQLNEKLLFNNQLCHKFIHQNMIFVLNEGFDTVITIIWDKHPTIIGNNSYPINSSNTIPSSHHISNNNNNNEYDTMIDEECIDEIVNNLISADLDDDITSPIPKPQPIIIPQYTANSSNYSPQYTPISQPKMYGNYSINNSTPGSDIDINPEVIIISNNLWNDISNRSIFNGHFNNKIELINLIYTAIYVKKIQHQIINDDIIIWIDSFYVYVTKLINDTYILYDIFNYNSYQNNYAKCIQKIQNNLQNDKNLLNVPISNGFIPNKLVKNNSKRSIISVTSTSSRSILSETGENKEYHTIYLKPIIERMKHLTNSNNIDTDYIISIVDSSIKNGTKRQISKRTFEFKYKSYTIIMSKSLKTILDVTISDIKDIITVHPDVVSIISKKCPILDYFTIQKLSNKAKLTGIFTTKKNDYRQQFIYDFKGCRIVFASNHTTIVEMQCNQPQKLQL